MIKPLLLISFFIGFYTSAEYQIQDQGETGTFSATPDADSGVVRYGYRIVTYDQWTGVEKKLLNLFPGFNPEKPNQVILYIAKISFVVNKPAGAIDLSRCLDLQNIRKLDTTVEQRSIASADIMTYKQAKYALHNPPEPAKWCDGPGKTICLQSNFTLPATYQSALALYETGKGSPYKTLEGQSEIRIEGFNDMNDGDSLRQLTGVGTAPAGALMQTTFWFTHAIEYIKLLAVLQPVPSRSSDTIVTGYMVFAIEKKTWDMKPLGFPVHDLILGKAGNTPEGILSGLPKLTQHLALSLADLLSR